MFSYSVLFHFFKVGVTTNWMSSFTAALGMMFVDYFISSEYDHFTYNTRLYMREEIRSDELTDRMISLSAQLPF